MTQVRRRPKTRVALLTCLILCIFSLAAHRIQPLTVRAHDAPQNDSLAGQPLSTTAQFDDPYSDFRNGRYSNAGLLNERDEVKLGTQLHLEVTQKFNMT